MLAQQAVDPVGIAVEQVVGPDRQLHFRQDLVADVQVGDQRRLDGGLHQVGGATVAAQVRGLAIHRLLEVDGPLVHGPQGAADQLVLGRGVFQVRDGDGVEQGEPRIQARRVGRDLGDLGLVVAAAQGPIDPAPGVEVGSVCGDKIDALGAGVEAVDEHADADAVGGVGADRRVDIDAVGGQGRDHRR